MWHYKSAAFLLQWPVTGLPLGNMLSATKLHAVSFLRPTFSFNSNVYQRSYNANSSRVRFHYASTWANPQLDPSPLFILELGAEMAETQWWGVMQVLSNAVLPHICGAVASCIFFNLPKSPPSMITTGNPESRRWRWNSLRDQLWHLKTNTHER